MAERGTLYRCHLFSFSGPQTEGVVSRWTEGLEPIGEREVLSGELVELSVKIQSDKYSLDEKTRVRFDIFEEDFLLTGGTDDHIVSLLGTNVPPPPDSFATQEKITKFQVISPYEALQDIVSDFRISSPKTFCDHILILKETDTPPIYYVVAWWQAECLNDYANSEFYFIVKVDDLFEDRSEGIMDVTEERSVTPEVETDLSSMFYRETYDYVLEAGGLRFDY